MLNLVGVPEIAQLQTIEDLGDRWKNRVKELRATKLKPDNILNIHTEVHKHFYRILGFIAVHCMI